MAMSRGLYLVGGGDFVQGLICTSELGLCPRVRVFPGGGWLCTSTWWLSLEGLVVCPGGVIYRGT